MKYTNMDIDHNGSRPEDHPGSYGDGSALPWMGHYPPVPVERFPTSTSRHPIVHEGFVPDDEEMMHEPYGIGAEDAAGVHPGETSQFGPYENANYDDNFNFSEDEDEDPVLSDRDGTRIRGHTSSDQDASTDEPDADKPTGVHVETRWRRRGRPRLSSAAPRSRGVGRDHGLGLGPKGGHKRGPRKPIEPSPEFVALQKEAINVFIDEQDHDKALDIIQRAIAINPEVYAAHALMSEIYMAKGDNEKALAALFGGAHAAPRTVNVWQQVADKCLQNTAVDRSRALAQAKYCYARILDFSPEDHDARFQRAAINRELGYYGKAMQDLETLLEDMPHNPSVLRQVAALCIESRLIDRAKTMYEESIAFYEQSNLSGESAFTWSDVNVYVELFAHLDQHEKGISTLKQLSRWLLGRKDEAYWDDVIEDDREWDADDDPRREEVPQYVAGRYPLESYGDGLPLELRVKLGIYRLHLGREYRNEAFGHFEFLEPEEDDEEAKIFDYSDLFREVGNALREFKEYEEALRYYEPVKEHNLCDETSFWLAIAASSYVCGKRDQAIQCYEAAKATDVKCTEARTQLSKLYKDRGDRDLALENAQEAIEISRGATRRTERRRYEKKEVRQQREAAERALKEANKMPKLVVDRRKQYTRPVLDFKMAQLHWQLPSTKRPSKGNTPSESWYRQRKKRQNMSLEEAERRRTANIQSLYSTLQDLTPAMREGDPLAHRTWLDCANELIADFRSMRVFYPAERHIKFQGYDTEAKQFAFQKKWKKEQQTREATETSEAVRDETMAPLDEADIPIPSTESSIPAEYRGISFSAWLDIFLEQATVLARMGQNGKSQCYITIDAALDCVIWYHEPESMIKIYICYFTCALALNDSPTMSNVAARWFMRQYAFCTDTYRLFSTLNLVYKYPPERGGKEMQMQNATWRQGPSQKFLFRQVKAIDALLPEDYNIDGEEGPVPQFMRTNLKQLETEEAADGPRLVTGLPQSLGSVKPKEMDVVLLTLYAQILYAGGSFPNALSYYFRAYALDPKNPMVLLSMALSYAHQMFKRQNENRHAYLMQGLAFFEEYAECRTAQGESDGELRAQEVCMEVEFNRARMWQMLGLNDLAIKGYAKVLGLGARAAHSSKENGTVDDEKGDPCIEEDYIMEAAYAMQTMYALSGDIDSAKSITEKYLVV